ncbi:MAG: hypothetical protein M3416_21335 [Acidobacteriota bacterium]|nr:hypothetical protein [Acidobacteriota bacterium]
MVNADSSTGASASHQQSAPTYFYERSKFRHDERPFKLYWRQPSGGKVLLRPLFRAFHDEGEAKAEVARLNSLVRTCSVSNCCRTVYPHEVALRDYSGREDLCEVHFAPLAKEQHEVSLAAL